MRSRERHALPRRRVAVIVLSLALGATMPATLVASAFTTDAATLRRQPPAVTEPDAQAPFPRHLRLAEPATTDDDQDAALRLGLAGDGEIARQLNHLQASSDRVSAEVIATTSEGRDVILVTLTAPESAAQATEQARLRDRIREQPTEAASDVALARTYKTPILVTNNVHGNEWEGTDAALRLIEDYASSTEPAVEDLLRTTRIHVVVSMNPDGRHDNTRRNAAGFDLNRDLITGTQPEVRGVRQALLETQPLLLLDLHGYVNGTLVEPTTPPHGENYEYDLLLSHAYPNALGMEAAINALGYDEADGVEPPQLPLRDWPQGWDDWPPIFVPQYAALHGAVAHTIELPLRVNNGSYGLPEEELRRRSAINTDIAHAAMTSTLSYAVTHRAGLLANQIEIFRRGVQGETPTPAEQGLFGLIGPEDIYLTDYPRGYVIPMGEQQRSAPAAARLVDHLLANGVTVTQLTAAAWIGGTSYPAGSYVVDLHQARRGLANTILSAGTDISGRVDAMYDISGWSHGLLWGADVVPVAAGEELGTPGERVTRASETASVASSSTGWVLRLLDPADVAALADLQGRGVTVQWLPDGDLLVPAGSRSAVEAVASAHGVQFLPAPPRSRGARLEEKSIGVAGTAEELWAFDEMGLQVQPVSTTALNDGVDLSDLDALYVSSGLSWRDLDDDARAELEAFVAGGGGLVGRGPAGAALNDALGLLEVTSVAGRSDANGVVAVDNGDTPIAGGASAAAFVYSPLWFTDLGAEVRVDQRLAQDPLVSGHWRPDGRGAGGPDAAAGQALVVSGTADVAGTRVVLFGSEPLFRAHPKGQYALVARALLWSSLD